MIIFGTCNNFSGAIESLAPQSAMHLDSMGITMFLYFNLSGYSNYPTLDLLVPPLEMLRNITMDEKMFDYQYANYIMSNDRVFAQLMQIMFPVYSTGEATVPYICISHSDMRDTIAESLMKFIQQRYGYNVTIIGDDPNDILSMTSGEFSVPGLYAMDEDYKRYLSMGGIPYDKTDGPLSVTTSIYD